MVENAKKALATNDCRAFFECFGFSIGKSKVGNVKRDNAYELEDFTSGGVDMVFCISIKDWKKDFKDYSHDFDIEEEIEIMRQDPSGSYCKAFTLYESLKDYESWKEWVNNIANIIDGRELEHFQKFISPLDAMDKWVFWSYNYSEPKRWIGEIWGNGCFGKHIMEKWVGAKMNMNKFYCELDTDNRKKLLNYILENYNK